MTRESAHDKGLRYLTEGRLTVVKVDRSHIDAVCKGGGESWRCGYRPGRFWWCDCPAKTTCSHLHALQAVTIRNREESP